MRGSLAALKSSISQRQGWQVVCLRGTERWALGLMRKGDSDIEAAVGTAFR
jgi:hypothetical protein